MTHLGIVQWIVLSVFAVRLGVYALKHGESKKPDTYDFRDALLNVIFWVITLWLGGFWG